MTRALLPIALLLSALECGVPKTRDAALPFCGEACFAESSIGRAAPQQVSPKSPAAPRIRLVPKYAAGQSLRYVLEFRTSTQTATAGAIENPQAPRQVDMTVNALIRIDVLNFTPDAAHPGAPPRVRLRSTYEKLITQAKADVPDPQLEEGERQYRALEGKSIEFTQSADGTVSEIKGLEQYSPEVRAAFSEWLGRLSLGISQPAEGIALGQKWIAAQPRTQPTPIEGISWQTESTYLRDEPCRPSELLAEGKTKPAVSNETCAVILTKFGITQKQLSDQTPEEYKKRGLRTGGRMGGSAESLTYISLATGFVVSVTQDGSEDMDITITNPALDLHMRYEGKVKTRSQISLIKSEEVGK